MNKEFIRVRTKADMVKSSALLVFGITLAVLPTSVGVNALGFFTLVTGVLLLTFRETGWQDTVCPSYIQSGFTYL